MVDSAVVAAEKSWSAPRAWISLGLWIKALMVGIIVALVCPLMIIGYQEGYYFHGLPNFKEYKNVQERKEAFIRYMLPLVYEANSDVRRQQHRMIRIYTTHAAGRTLSESDSQWAIALAARYKVKDFTLEPTATKADKQQGWERMFRKVDVVPVSLVLAQAANESAWGTSRFARDGYNLFGEWCYTEGCGIKPLRREEGKTHEVRSFNRVYDSVASYMHNLNSNNAYAEFRELRVSMRRRGEVLDGAQLADGLKKYSSEGTKYVDIIRSVIDQNALQQFDGIQSAKEKDNSKLSS